jgi:hypothetical protein
LLKRVLDPVLVTVLHPLQFVNRVIMAGLLGGVETLLEFTLRGFPP